ncbi:MAG: hypothetical protein IPJ58_09690 [Ardenticatenia bacterium]|nr:hypothetical protein [Ardenticatenia bacterium]
MEELVDGLVGEALEEAVEVSEFAPLADGGFEQGVGLLEAPGVGGQGAGGVQEARAGLAHGAGRCLQDGVEDGVAGRVGAAQAPITPERDDELGGEVGATLLQSLIAGGEDLGEAWFQTLGPFLRLGACEPGASFDAEGEELGIERRLVVRRHGRGGGRLGSSGERLGLAAGQLPGDGWEGVMQLGQ